MKAKKDIPKQKKIREEKTEYRNLLLNELIRITQALCPNKSVENPFKPETQAISRRLEIQESLLLEDLLQSITLLNQSNRKNGSGKLISTETDFVNALELIMPQGEQLRTKQIEIIETLGDKFGSQGFTYQEAGLILRKSISTLKRYFAPLIAHKLLEPTQEYKDKKRLFRLLEPEERTEKQQEESMHEIAMGDWKDFVGFVEL